MKIYRIHGDGNYARAMGVVAANSPEEAVKCLKSFTNDGWAIDFGKAYAIRGAVIQRVRPVVLAYQSYIE